jgi:hypothetical protein
MKKIFYTILFLTVISSSIVFSLDDGDSQGDCIKGNCQDGNGTQTILNNGTHVGEYVGPFKNGKFEGYGVYTSAGFEYKGQFKEGNKEGQGTLKWPNGSNGAMYVGQWKDNDRNGFGTKIESNGNKYVGQWKDGKKAGPGTLYDVKGKILSKGIWKNDEIMTQKDICKDICYVQYNKCAEEVMKDMMRDTAPLIKKCDEKVKICNSRCGD